MNLQEYKIKIKMSEDLFIRFSMKLCSFSINTMEECLQRLQNVYAILLGIFAL